MDQGGHKGDSSDSRARDHKQRPPECYAQRLQHVDAQHSGGEAGGQGTVHVPS